MSATGGEIGDELPCSSRWFERWAS